MPQIEKKVYDADVEENKLIAALSYVWILFLIPLLAKKSSKFTQFHAKQGLVLFVIELIIGILGWIPLIGQLLVIVVIIIAAIGFVKAYNGEWWKAPFIYNWSEKFKI